MSASRKLRRSLGRSAARQIDGLTQPDRLRQIEDAAKVDPMTGEKTAIYGVRCCWWTSDRRQVAPMPGGRIPSCPFCHSVLMEAPLQKFIASARENTEHYGPRGLDAFADAHGAPCHASWGEYR